ncbi:MAG TPA: site-2 protease family protein [Thermoanaerobaculia bacterium]|nr:site-2 protease family protein [Thermoanaerobaculia bacterium]
MTTTILFTGAVQMLLLLLSISAHESAHAWVADRRGDSTSRLLGRISLNPLRHLDPFGTLILPLALVAFGLPVFGWGRPPLVLGKNLRRPYWDSLLIAGAGPAANLLLALLATVAIGVAATKLGPDGREAATKALFEQTDAATGRLGGFPLMFTLVRMATLNAFLAVFNLLPLPPLDGGQIALLLLPADWAAKLAALRPYGFMIGIVLAMVGVVTVVLLPFYGVLSVVINLL